MVGKPFEFGGSGPNNFDTSGLIYYCFKQSDVSIPRTVVEQYNYGTAVEKEDLQPGDAVFFYMETPDEAEYVGIYVGDDTFICASSSKNAVREVSFSNAYFAERYLGARRY